jgi:hypothetical protein
MACKVYACGGRSGRSLSRHSWLSSFVICPRGASHGTLWCSASPVTAIPASMSAVTISPRPWFHSCVVV